MASINYDPQNGTWSLIDDEGIVYGPYATEEEALQVLEGMGDND